MVAAYLFFLKTSGTPWTTAHMREVRKLVGFDEIRRLAFYMGSNCISLVAVFPARARPCKCISAVRVDRAA